MPNVVSIPPGVPFLATLVENLFSGNLIEGFQLAEDPLALARVTIWLPTRRSVRKLQGEILSKLDSNSAVLPNIRALSEPQEETFLFTDQSSLNHVSVSLIDRQLILGRLIHSWATILNQKQQSLYEGAEIIMPSSMADAVFFADDLARLIDIVMTEELDWSRLEEFVPDEHAEWWKVTLKLLKIAIKAWPDYLNERGLCDPNIIRTKALHHQAAIYRNQDPQLEVVIAAGSTGSIPATAKLLKTIANMEKGLVILPGLDRDMDRETWDKIDLNEDNDSRKSEPAHPQFGLKRLLSYLKISIDEVNHIGTVDKKSARVREHLVSEALRPSFSTDRWQEFLLQCSSKQRQEALSNVALIEASSEHQEALALALALRETLESPSKTVALITPDRNLARRVRSELKRLGLECDNSTGMELRNLPQGQFLQLIVHVAFSRSDPIALVSLLKHPFSYFGLPAETHIRGAITLELTVFRNFANPIRPHEVPSRLAKAKSKITKENHFSFSKISTADWENAAILAKQVAAIFPETENEIKTLSNLALSTIQKVEACGRTNQDSLNHIYDDECGKALYQFLAEMLDCDGSFVVSSIEWPKIVDSLLSKRMVRLVETNCSRLSILSPIEARLQQYDRVVLGGLNEKRWPVVTQNDPFLSRSQKSELFLPSPDRLIGLAAHDFQMLMGIEDIILSLSKNLRNTPSVPSRWVQRICLLGGEESVNAMRKKGTRFMDWADQIDQPQGQGKLISQPAPKPPVHDRPMSLSVTEIQSWIEDPYVIYARHILKLRPLGSLIPQEKDQDREKGILYHAILEDLSLLRSQTTEPLCEDRLQRLMKKHFDRANIRRDQYNLWWIHFEEILNNFQLWDESQRQRIIDSYVEIYGKMQLESGFVLKGKVDRIDVKIGGGVEIIDYKTSQRPTKKSVKQLESPQLPLEALMVYAGAFKSLGIRSVEELSYVRLCPNGEIRIDGLTYGQKNLSANQLSYQVLEKLRTQIKAYNNPNQPYLSKARLIQGQRWPDDYDHLARVREWSINGEIKDE
ncbi:double-strand break repair protein AddB [Candidatus Endowatersipora endosymbiont of Watersipora subatra]|uniref:double-strand break repair protein AddB n=1 Tax=Candidatus Endowatersipora endosymbiont of Watersipora subatra TaxID=3077946 RepID=UPI00312C9D47